jgi:AraC-like DNA-binding protein
MDSLAELRDLIGRLAARGRQNPVDGVTVFSSPTPTEPLGAVTRPSVAFVAQGAKRVALADRVVEYHAGQYLVVSVDLPLVAEITDASPDAPFLAFGLTLKPALIAALLLEAPSGLGPVGDSTAMVVGEATDDILDAAIRLLRFTDDSADLSILGPGVERELHWRLMRSPLGSNVRQIGMADGRLAHVGRATRWIRDRYDRVIRIDDLADHVGTSVASLNRHFRTVTGMSPLQYQKQLRLQEARIRLIGSPRDVAGVGYGVGYDSPSQFSREYRRLFGLSPAQDAVRMLS